MSRNSQTHVRIRSTLLRQWVWHLVTDDGHVAHTCEPFGDRAACEADARLQGLPVIGARKVAATKDDVRRREGDRVYSTRGGIWTWERVKGGSVVATAPMGFLTREECESNLRLFELTHKKAA